ncbi:MAG: hypothetical protein Q9222_007810 [Ikaeria aurantiellina]
MTDPTGAWYFIRDPSVPVDEDEGANDSDDDDDDINQSSDPDSDSSDPEFPRPDTYNPKREKRLTGDYPIRTFRTLPSDELINPLLLAMARSAGQMPVLQSMSLVSTIRDQDAAGFEVHIHAKGNASKFDDEPADVDIVRLYWFVGSWRPDEGALKAWREGKEGVVINPTLPPLNRPPQRINLRQQHRIRILRLPLILTPIPTLQLPKIIRQITLRPHPRAIRPPLDPATRIRSCLLS